MRGWSDPIPSIGIYVINRGDNADLIFNVSTGTFEGLPADGTPLEAHLIKPTHYGTSTGAFGRIVWFDVPPGAIVAGAALVALSLDGNGKPIGGSGAEMWIEAIDPGTRTLTLTLGPP
jgi:hypothetical protein